MASLTFSAAVMEDIRAAMRQHRQDRRAAREVATPPLTTPMTHHGEPCEGEAAMVDAEVYESGGAKRLFDSWAQDLDDQTLPEMDNDELRILHALLFGAGDDAFAVADELLKQALASGAH